MFVRKGQQYCFTWNASDYDPVSDSQGFMHSVLEVNKSVFDSCDSSVLSPGDVYNLDFSNPAAFPPSGSLQGRKCFNADAEGTYYYVSPGGAGTVAQDHHYNKNWSKLTATVWCMGFDYEAASTATQELIDGTKAFMESEYGMTGFRSMSNVEVLLNIHSHCRLNHKAKVVVVDSEPWGMKANGAETQQIGRLHR